MAGWRFLFQAGNVASWPSWYSTYVKAIVSGGQDFHTGTPAINALNPTADRALHYIDPDDSSLTLLEDDWTYGLMSDWGYIDRNFFVVYMQEHYSTIDGSDQSLWPPLTRKVNNSIVPTGWSSALQSPNLASCRVGWGNSRMLALSDMQDQSLGGVSLCGTGLSGSNVELALVCAFDQSVVWAQSLWYCVEINDVTWLPFGSFAARRRLLD